MLELQPLIYKNRSLLRFYDATFITKSKESRIWIKSLCDEIEKRNLKIPFDAFIRANSFDFRNKDDINLLHRLNKNGMISTYIGLESGSDSTLDLYNKKIGVNESEIAFNVLKNLNMHGATNGCMTFQQNSAIGDIVETVHFLYRIGLCSFWNCLTRAETLPGIELEIATKERETCWDVYNYNFINENVDTLYSVMSNINRKYGSIRIEDRLIRSLRERIKIEMYYDEIDIELKTIQLNLEKSIKSIQKLNHDYILDLCRSIVKYGSKYINEKTLLYLSKHNNTLKNINKDYGWILEYKK